MRRLTCDCNEFVCNRCGYVPEIMTTHKEEYNPGELRDIYDIACKRCKRGEYVKGVYCADCEEIVSPNESFEVDRSDYVICKDCLSNYAIPEYALEFGETIAPRYEINAFFDYVLGEKGVKEALMEYMKNHPEKFVGKAIAFCLDITNITDFADFIINNDKEL